MTNTATAKQIDFIARLSAERVIANAAALAADLEQGLTTKQASDWISALLASPRAAAAAPAGDRLAAALEPVEISKYAVPTAGLILPGVRLEGDLLFLEVRNYMGRKYLRRLHGAPGGFWRSKFSVAESLALAAVIAGKHVEYARLFGEHYACCGRCGAELTDQRSRELFLGPDCRKVFGL